LFDDLEKLQHRDGVKQGKRKLVEVGTRIKTEKEMLEEGMSKIPNCVPYDNYTGMTIIDKTKLPSNTKKSINEGKRKL